MGTKRKKMTIQERAKQFMPFSPLNGLQKALREKEESINKIERPQLSEDLIESINIKLKDLEKNITDSSISKAQISFFESGKMTSWTGTVVGFNKELGKLQLEDNSAVNIEDIIELEFL